MAKTRLTNADRDAINAAILNHKFLPIEAGIKAEENALALQARVKAYGDYLPTIEAAPKGAFVENSAVDVNVGGRRLRLCFGADYAARCRLFDSHNDGYLLQLTDTDAFGKKLVGWAERAEAAKKERRELRSTLSGTLSRFHSFDDLQKGWPEADKFIVQRWRERGDYTANVPAIAIRDLSAALDLPPETEALAA